MGKSKLRGHEIEVYHGEWIYSVYRIPTLNYPDIFCGHCGKDKTDEGHDACLGTLPLISNACCGHGMISDTYIQFFNFLCFRGRFAKIVIKILKRWRVKSDL